MLYFCLKKRYPSSRHMVEYGEVVCPSSGTRYRLQRVVPLLALSCHALPDQNVPARILRHCVVMGVPCISSRSCEHVVKVRGRSDAA